MFHFLDHIGEEVSRFVALLFLVASPFEHCSYIMNTIVRMTSVEPGGTLEKYVRAVHMSAGSEESRNNTTTGIPKRSLVRDGTVINLTAISTSLF